MSITSNLNIKTNKESWDRYTIIGNLGEGILYL